MPESIETDRTSADPLLASAEFVYRKMFFPLGFPIELATNSEDMLQSAAESWSLFPEVFHATPIRLQLGVQGKQRRLPDPPQFRSRVHVMSIISDADNFVVCDFKQGFAFGWVTETVAANHVFLRYHFLDAAVLTLAGQRYFAPVHGSLIQKHGCGILLCGDSSAGKSTLAYACARADWTFVADEAVFLLRSRPDCYGIGNPYSICLRESAKQLFPELAGYSLVTRPNGKVGFEVCTREFPISFGSSIGQVVFLNRYGECGVQLEPYPKKQALQFWRQFVGYGEEKVIADQIRAYERLLEREVWEMHYCSLDDAIQRLEQLTLASAEPHQ